MSNVIKSRHAYLNEIQKKVIDTNDKSEQFRVIHLEQYKAIHETSLTIESDSSEFTEGIEATHVDRDGFDLMDEKATQKYDEIIEKANLEAELILHNAKLEAERIKEKVYLEAKENGYQDGYRKGEEDVLKAKEQVELLSLQKQEDYEEQIANLEPKFAEVVAMLVTKLTGVVVEDKKDIIIYLLHNALSNSYNSKSYIIKTSKDDYEIVLSRKDELQDIVGSNTELEIIKDNELSKNQCYIETDTSVIDLSLDIQLTSLVEDIKLLSMLKE